MKYQIKADVCRQCDAFLSQKTQANRFGFTWLDEWRAVAATSEGRVK